MHSRQSQIFYKSFEFTFDSIDQIPLSTQTTISSAIYFSFKQSILGELEAHTNLQATLLSKQFAASRFNPSTQQYPKWYNSVSNDQFWGSLELIPMTCDIYNSVSNNQFWGSLELIPITILLGELDAHTNYNLATTVLHTFRYKLVGECENNFGFGVRSRNRDSFGIGILWRSSLFLIF